MKEIQSSTVQFSNGCNRQVGTRSSIWISHVDESAQRLQLSSGDLPGTVTGSWIGTEEPRLKLALQYGVLVSQVAA